MPAVAAAGKLKMAARNVLDLIASSEELARIVGQRKAFVELVDPFYGWQLAELVDGEPVFTEAWRNAHGRDSG